MVDLTVFSEREIGNRERLEDYAVNEYIETPAGLRLQLAIACDGAGGGEVGERAARLTARSVIEHIEISTERNIPRLLIDAITDANEVVFGELRGSGTSTIAMIAVDVNDPSASYGRMFVASVGDSFICLMRDNQLIRLNIDHTLANEYIYAGQMSVAEANRLDNANYPTRVIGVNPEIQVDIGFYAERGRSFVNSQRAFNIGKQGLMLKEGDTAFVASDGIFRSSDGKSKPYVHRDELLRHALDDSVERAVRNILRYASQRRLEDNACLSMIFVPSRVRRPVRLTQGVSRLQQVALVAVLVIAILLVLFVAIQVFGAG